MSVLVGRGVGPQVNKFEQVSCDDHQMSVGGGGGKPHVWYPGEGVGVQTSFAGGNNLRFIFFTPI